MKVFLDTNIFVRYLVNDDPKKFSYVKQLIENIEAGDLRPYTSNLVVFELFHVMTKIYKIPMTTVIEDVEELLKLHNLTIIEKTNIKQALSLCKTTKVKLSDCLIALQCPKDCKLVSYDKDFKQFDFLKVTSPEDVL